jgi:hypothetical protein
MQLAPIRSGREREFELMQEKKRRMEELMAAEAALVVGGGCTSTSCEFSCDPELVNATGLLTQPNP